MKKFILGLKPSISESPFLNTAQIYNKVGHNVGNLAFHYAIDQQLGGNLKVIDWSAPVEEIDAAGDIAVLPCANQLGSHLDYAGLAKKFSNIKSNIVAIGLGAQAGADGKIPEVPQGTLDWIRAIAEHAGSGPNITVRGKFTFEVLEHYGLADNAQVMGCPSLFINTDKTLGQKIVANLKEPKRIAVTSGHQLWKHLARIEASLAHMVTATSGSYIGQSPLEMVAISRGEAAMLSPEQLADCRDYACPEMDLDEFIQWTKRHGNVFFDIPSWMEHYRRFDFVVGLRIHGVMLALQAGVPSLCIAHDSRTIELCQTMKIPYVYAHEVIHGIERKNLMKLFNFNPDEFDSNRKKILHSYIGFLESNKLNFKKP